jgi:ribonuclease P/MRP protein subunit POP5
MKKLKPILPSLREKKRYMAFEVISESKLSYLDIQKAVETSLKDYVGTQGKAKAGLLFFKDKYNEKAQKGLIKVNHKHTDELRASFAFIQSINGKKAIIKSIGLSGIMKKAYNNYVAA